MSIATLDQLRSPVGVFCFGVTFPGCDLNEIELLVKNTDVR